MTNYLPIVDSRSLLEQVSSLHLYQSVFDDEVGAAFIDLLHDISICDRQSKTNKETAEVNCLQVYGRWFKILAATGQSWQDHLITKILLDENPFSQQVQKIALEDLPSSLIAAVKHDLQIVQNIYNCSTQTICEWVQTASNSPLAPIPWIERSTKTFFARRENWTEALEALAGYYRQHGTGIFARYRALRWQQGKLIGIVHPDPVQLSEIVGYESQKEVLLKNTEFLWTGYPALHILLYGSRGSGKSSLIKGLLNQYGDRGLRLIEVSKAELKDLPVIVEQLWNVPQKFIIFVDDLSFEEDDDAFKALKVVLEGSLTARANNVIVYATSNRRHLIREFFGDRPRPREGDEVHAWDTLQEKLSFSDRFGLTLTFEPANQDTYLKIVNHLAKRTGINIAREDLEFRAKQWATRHNGRSGRTAKQFIDYLRAELATS
ncbi:ATP-binding protein [Pleurocapsales cyanobacterium LEGE 06147]|nr:ATP-binding protein [Pleurocapsales cyanobacterium LEGE 06147]